MRSSELAQMLRHLAGQAQSKDPGFDPARAVEMMRLAADRLTSATHVSTVGHHAKAFEHSSRLGNTHALDFALGAGWHAEQIEKGNLDCK